ncbi:hypothetical protein HK097_004740, partial [Rhizophlyctis rosea]
MGKSAADYILRVRAGASYDPTTLQTAYVNDEQNPILIDTPHFTGYLVVRVLNFNGVTPDPSKPLLPNPASNYFHGRNRRYSISIQGRFKKDWNGDEVIFGTDFDTKIRTPTGCGLAMKIAKWLDPALEADLQCEKPWLYSPFVSAMNALAVFDPSSPEIQNPSSSHKHHHSSTSSSSKSNRISPSDPSTALQSLSLSSSQQPPQIGLWSFHTRMVPEDPALLFPNPSSAPTLTAYEKRKKHFGVTQTRSEVTLSSSHIYAMDFYDAYFDFGTLTLKLPGFSVNALRYWDGQPLRFVCRTRKGMGKPRGEDDGTVFFTVVFELVEREGANSSLRRKSLKGVG